MDLRLYLRVLWRFRIIVGVGLVLACALSFLSYAKVSFKGGSPKISYRQAVTYQATSLVFLTQKGFPYGYTVLPYQQTPGTGKTPAGFLPEYGSPGTFTQLAVYYALFVHSDTFQTLLRRHTRVPGIVNAKTVMDSTGRNPLPYLDIAGFATSPTGAVTLANAGSKAFSDYLVGQENANHVPPSRRVQAEVVSKATQATVSNPRKKTTPIVVLLTVLLAAIGLSFVLENLRPRIRPLATDEAEPVATSTARRPA